VADEDEIARADAEVNLRVLELPLERLDGADAEVERAPRARVLERAAELGFAVAEERREVLDLPARRRDGGRKVGRAVLAAAALAALAAAAVAAARDRGRLALEEGLVGRVAELDADVLLVRHFEAVDHARREVDVAELLPRDLRAARGAARGVE
jgi:anti-sigma-K factor RskA